MQWNKAILIVFIIWIFQTPILISYDHSISHENFTTLMVFDTVFMVDRILELFVSYYNPNGSLEHKLHSVILNNIS